uniref:Nucleotide-diphospho-sugar transferase domain-containing protein n=1 Tax=Ascaris lumbricoides TaxID=6252 RepID=A0A9J2P741_ASCLU
MPIDLECLCVFENVEYDFCYHLPENYSIRGEKFTCENAHFLHSLGLLKEGSQRRDVDRYVNLEMMELPTVVMVTAFSEDHWPEARRLISTIRRFWPYQKVIVYDLGLEAVTVYAVRQLCNVEYRKFDFSAYPSYVHRLGEFRWKPLIIAETLQEFGAIWYLDTSVVFKKGDLNHVYELVRCKRMRSRSKVFHMIPSVGYRDRRETTSALESGWNQRLWRSNLRECAKSTYLLHSFTGHGIFAATHPGCLIQTYRFFPTNFEEIKKQKAKMYEAGLIFAVYTADTVANILRWYVACALEEGCMGSRTPLSYCNFNTDRFAVFANCHRYDQSVVNLLIANAFFYDRHYYTSEIVDFFNIIRGTVAITTDDALHCRLTDKFTSKRGKF